MIALCSLGSATACTGGQVGTQLALRGACPDAAYWDGHACAPRGDGEAKLLEGKSDLAKSDLDAAKATLEAVKGPLAHAANVTLWEQRGITAAYLEDEAGANAAFETLLALDPGHFLSYTLSPKATFLFEKVRARVAASPAIDVNWANGQKVGQAIPLDIEVLADPKHFLTAATLFVRARGEPAWRAADVALDPAHAKRIVLPAIQLEHPTSLELYVRAYDGERNEVLVWADPSRPREIPLRYDPPPPWYRTWWVLAIAGTVAAVTTGVIVYELTLSPPDKFNGAVH